MSTVPGRIIFDFKGPDMPARRRNADHARFIGLLSRMSPQDRKVVSALVWKVAEAEAHRGEEAALDLIDDLEEVILSAER